MLRVNLVSLSSKSGLPGLVGSGSLGRILLLYAALLLAGGWAYAALRIHADREQTLNTERIRLTAVTAVLETDMVAMLNDGIGAAVAGANEIASLGGMRAASDAQLTGTLQRMLTGGQYVRSLFIAGSNRFARAGRDGANQTASLSPAWLTLPDSRSANRTWVGTPFPDPDRPQQMAVPIARRVDQVGGEVIWAGGLFDFGAIDALGGRISRTVGFAGIVAQDGTVLMSLRFSGLVLTPGLNIIRSPLFLLASGQPGAGIVEGFAPKLGAEILAAHESVQDYPIKVFSGESLESVLAVWRQRRVSMLATTVASSAVLMLMTALLMRSASANELQQRTEIARSQRIRTQSAALLQMANRSGQGLSVVPPFHDICATGASVLDADHVSIWLLEDSARVLRLVEQFHRGLASLRPGLALASSRVATMTQALSSERVIHAEDVSSDASLKELVETDVSLPHARSIIAAAIRISGEFAGMVLILQTNRRAWHLDEVTFAGGLADRIAQMLLYAQRERVLDDLRVLAGELMRSQDQERRRIGRDLHDSTGQVLATLELDLERLLSHSESLSAEQRTRLAGCVELSHQCSAEIRTASYLLHPPLLDELGLISAIRWLADGFRERSGIEVRLDLPGSIARLSPEAELTLFRVAQEALTNVQRHARSPWIEIRVKASPEHVELEVEDAGMGSPAQESWRADAHNAVGVGLAGMRERVRQVGGAFSVQSTNSGTCIRASVPARGTAVVAALTT